MKILYFSNGERGERCLDALMHSRHKVLYVIGEPSRPGRWNPGKVKSLAEENGIGYTEANVNSDEFINFAASLKADIFVLSGYTKILNGKLLSVPPKGVINLHGGKLPAYRGGSPLNWQIVRGETELGLSILYADKGIDTGDIITQKTYHLDKGEDATTAYERLLDLFPPALIETLDKIEDGSVNVVKQDLGSGFTYPKRRPDDSRIFWDKYSAEEIVNLVRALTPPYPGAFCFCKGRRIVINNAKATLAKGEAMPGKVVAKNHNGVIVSAKNGAVLIDEKSCEIGDFLE